MTENHNDYINKINSFDFAKYNFSEKVIDILIPENQLSIDNKYFLELYKLIDFLEEEKTDFPILFETIKLKDLNLAFYAKCLERYIHQVLDEGIPHSETCWGSHCEKIYDIGYISQKNEEKASKMTEIFFKQLEINRKHFNQKSNLFVVNNWLKFFDQNHEIKKNTLIKKLKFLIKEVFNLNYDRSIKLANKIKKEKFKKELFYVNKLGMNVVLGYSEITKNYMIFHGKHRITVLKYLQSIGELDINFELAIPKIRYNSNHFRQSAPGLECYYCK